MKQIEADLISEKIANLYWEININQSPFIKEYFQTYNSENEQEKFVIDNIIDNAEKAKTYNIPLCQDTGVPIIFIDKPHNYIINGYLKDSLKKEFKRITQNGLRNAIKMNPLQNENSFNWNEPFYYVFDCDREKMRIILLVKGAGSENVSKSAMLNPSSNIDEIIEFIIETIKSAGAKACPPYILGIGIGGTREQSELIAKKALSGYYEHNKNDYEKYIAHRVIEQANKLSIGIQGLNFGKTVLDCRVKTVPSHIASLSISVSFQCFHERVGFFEL